MTTLPYIEILPGNLRHRQLIAVALKVGDKQALSALKGNTRKTIHFVTNWFFYALVQNGHDRPDAVVIYSPQTRLDMAKAQTHQQQADEQPLVSISEEPAIPLNTYDFLL